MLVVAANHHKPGKPCAATLLAQMDLRDVRAGSVIHKTMRPRKIEPSRRREEPAPVR